MKWNILHESRGRIRLHLRKPRMSLAEADQLQDYLTSLPGVCTAAVYERTCDVVIVYTESRAGIVRGLAAFRFDTEALAEVPANSPRAVNREYQEKLVNMTIFHLARKLFLPAPLRMVYTLVRSVPYIFRGLRCVFRRKLEVEVLDALSIGVSMLRGDFGTAGSVMFLLRLGELLEEWTRKKSLGDLARCMSLNVDRVWQQTAEGEVLVPISQVCAGDAIVVHTGSVIPLDGRVLDGEASVNQASLTGEAEPVRKSEGAVVYAGTVVEEGQITVTVEQQAGNGRYDQIVKMIENSEKLKSASETRAAALADKLVPYSLLGTAVTDGNADAYLPYFAEGGAVQAYKLLFNLSSCVESFAALGVDVGTMDDRIPLDRTVLAQEVEAARATRSTQSTADEADKATYTPGYILRHPVDTVLLFVRSAVENGDHYIRTLVGGSLSYYTVDLAWGWVAVLYLLLAYAALPVQGAVMKPAGKARGWCCAAAALCCLLAVAGCLLWTPTHYDTLYGLQGRYFLPVLPLHLLTSLPRRLAAEPDEDTAQTRLVAALALVQAGMVVNIMLAIIAR